MVVTDSPRDTLTSVEVAAAAAMGSAAARQVRDHFLAPHALLAYLELLGKLL